MDTEVAKYVRESCEITERELKEQSAANVADALGETLEKLQTEYKNVEKADLKPFRTFEASGELNDDVQQQLLAISLSSPATQFRRAWKNYQTARGVLESAVEKGCADTVNPLLRDAEDKDFVNNSSAMQSKCIGRLEEKICTAKCGNAKLGLYMLRK